MCLHENKICPRCSNTFECKPGNITQCHCYGISFTMEEKAFLEDRYHDCLCAGCLKELKNRYIMFKEKFLYR